MAFSGDEVGEFVGDDAERGAAGVADLEADLAAVTVAGGVDADGGVGERPAGVAADEPGDASQFGVIDDRAVAVLPTHAVTVYGMTKNEDPMEVVHARVRAASDQLGAALGEAVRLAFRRLVAVHCQQDLGPGPWILYPNGRVRAIPADLLRGDPDQEIGDIEES